MTLYMKYSDKHGNVSIQQHQVWDRERFIHAQMTAHAKEGGTALPTDQEDYRDHNWSKR